MRTFVETETFRRVGKAYDVSDENIKSAQNEILKRPQGDAHLCQTLYKIRVPRLSKGKKGGFRYWYFYFEDKIYLVLVLPKNEGENILKAVQSEICKKIATILKGAKDDF